MTTKITALLCVFLTGWAPSVTAQELAAGTAVSLKRDSALHFKDRAYRVGKAGETFRVAAHRTQEKRVYVYAKDPRGQDIALWVEESAIKPVQPKDGTTQAALAVQPQATFENSLGMKLAPVPITGGPTSGKRVLFSIWDTRVQDYAAYAAEIAGVNKEWRDAEHHGEKQGPTHPVVNVNWGDAKAFCAWLTKKERSAGQLNANSEYRLPTDHEWSCAVGIGDREDPNASPLDKSEKISGIYPWGNVWPPPKGAGNYLGEGEDLTVGFPPSEIGGYRDGFKFTSPVGSFEPNKYGLYDMGGNVWQWCEDCSDVGRVSHILRGGSCLNRGSAAELLASNRCSFSDRAAFSARSAGFGFRVVLSPKNNRELSMHEAKASELPLPTGAFPFDIKTIRDKVSAATHQPFIQGDTSVIFQFSNSRNFADRRIFVACRTADSMTFTFFLNGDIVPIAVMGAVLEKAGLFTESEGAALVQLVDHIQTTPRSRIGRFEVEARDSTYEYGRMIRFTLRLPY